MKKSYQLKGGKHYSGIHYKCFRCLLSTFLYFLPGKRLKPELLNGCPPGSPGITQSTGWVTTESFVNYLKHFVHHAKPSDESPILPIVDASHISLEGRSNTVVLLGLPPHTTHKLQPLDVSFFGPLKAFYNKACDSFMVNKPGIPITDRNLGPMFGEAYGRAATVNNAVKGFRACGIEPFNANIFEESDFAPSVTSKRNYEPNVFITGDTNNTISVLSQQKTFHETIISYW